MTDTPLENASIHNYFLAKSIDNLRSGGIAAFVVSSSFLDSDNARTEELRNYMADRADLVGAIRLPNKTFGDSNAGVTSDIVFFKRHDGTNNLSRDWTATGKVNISQEYGRVQGVQNKYFIYHPDQIIGKMEMVDGRYGPAPACVDERYGQDGYSLKTEISRRLASMPEKFYVPHDHLKITHDDCDREFMGSVYYMNLKPMQFFEGPDGKLCQKNTSDDFYHAYKLPDGNAGMRVRGMIKIRDDLRTLINAEKSEESSDEDLDALRADLNRDYDAFVKKYGYLNSADKLKLFDNDPESPLILSLEGNYQKSLRKNIKKKKTL